jgi:hypothetical protein
MDRLFTDIGNVSDPRLKQNLTVATWFMYQELNLPFTVGGLKSGFAAHPEHRKFFAAAIKNPISAGANFTADLKPAYKKTMYWLNRWLDKNGPDITARLARTPETTRT